MIAPANNLRVRHRIELSGRVQGVGFRPHVYRLAQQHGLWGRVFNEGGGVRVEVEGPAAEVAAFEHDLTALLPPMAQIGGIVVRDLPPGDERTCDRGFRIDPSALVAAAAGAGEIPPDVATCADCLRELTDPRDRRYGYPFINCTNCGPRYTIIRSMPYDRERTTMASFAMCADCRREYEDPLDRRFHAQPIACPRCGPRVRMLEAGGRPIDACDWVQVTAAALRSGQIAAIKGLGGYHLACRADDETAVRRLRERKGRESKPLAVMVANLAAAERIGLLSAAHEAALQQGGAPIVLAPQRRGHGLAPSVARGSSSFGLMLPYTPLHHLLVCSGLPPLVMTSANLSDEPLLYRDEQALAELKHVADLFVLHDREIVRPVDDSVAIVFEGRVTPVRRARGWAPSAVRLHQREDAASEGLADVLAVGGELKSAVCTLKGEQAVLSEHIGDLDSPGNYRRFERSVADLCDLLKFEPAVIAHDLHPLYQSTRYASGRGLPRVAVQHHHAHLAALMAEHAWAGPLVGVICDGTGLGTDGTIWGCEVLWSDGPTFRRLAHLAPFPLLGGDAAAIESWRPAAALLALTYGSDWPLAIERACPAIAERLERAAGRRLAKLAPLPGVQRAPRCSSLGRMFDAVAFLLGLGEYNAYEGQCACAVQAAADEIGGLLLEAATREDGVTRAEDAWIIHPDPLIRRMVAGVGCGEPASRLAAEFHAGLGASLARAAMLACGEADCSGVGLSGGCFANTRLLGEVAARLAAAGLRVLVHEAVPPGDGGLALGQAYVARRLLETGGLPSLRPSANRRRKRE